MTFRIAIRALNRNKVRSGLTTLGVVIGTAAVIAVVAIGQGATSAMQKQMASMGTNQILVFPGASSSGAVNFGSGSVQTLTPQDEQSIVRECPSAEYSAVIVRARAQIVNGSINWSPNTVQGCDTDFLAVREWEVVEGENFSEQHVRGAATVCLVGKTVVDKVFEGESPVGKRIRVKGLPFTVLGVLAKKGTNTWGQDQDDVLLMPYTTVKKKVQGSQFNNVDQIVVRARNAAAMDSLEQEIKDCLRVAHRIPKNARGGYEDDFQVMNATEMRDAQASMTRLMTVLLAAVAFISLLVGGIGIMNIMLVSVTERTREIGLRMAVGARGRDILAQFLVEAVSLSAMGGLAGVALGSAGALGVASMLRWPTLISPVAVAIAIGFSAAVGVIFGLYPAWRASKLDPIEALRYE
ncbi:MAG: ABC transporter permease [Planctomycetota bacterium]